MALRAILIHSSVSLLAGSEFMCASHGDKQNPAELSTRRGWLGRYAAACSSGAPSPVLLRPSSMINSPV